jgi:hypothetical protein
LWANNCLPRLSKDSAPEAIPGPFLLACESRTLRAIEIQRAMGYSLLMTKTAQPNPSRTDDDEEFLAAVQEGIADADAGRMIPYEKIRRWLLSWGTENELPPPE